MAKFNYKEIFNSFRSRILFSFLLLKAILILWIVVYLNINAKEKHLQEFSIRLSNVQNQFLASSRFLQNFILSGYEQGSFYDTHQQADIDTFSLSRTDDLNKIKALKIEAKQFNLQLSASLDTIFNE